MGKNANIAFALLLLSAAAHADFVLPPVCNDEGMNELALLSFFALLAASLFVALAYMLGKAIESPRISTWCKTEVWQVFASAISCWNICCPHAFLRCNPCANRPDCSWAGRGRL